MIKTLLSLWLKQAREVLTQVCLDKAVVGVDGSLLFPPGEFSREILFRDAEEGPMVMVQNHEVQEFHMGGLKRVRISFRVEIRAIPNSVPSQTMVRGEAVVS